MISSWKDAFIASHSSKKINDFIKVPQHGVFTDHQEIKLAGGEARVLKNIWSLGGENGWFYANKLWAFRGLLDKAAGGVGLRRGRTNAGEIHPGDALDFWESYCGRQAREKAAALCRNETSRRGMAGVSDKRQHFAANSHLPA
ncbi:MAG: DUF2867 domain-containing protein [Bacteroidales bacterium]|nr:DUF2867 domain-containing protein [Bacteroidales bacterium]